MGKISRPLPVKLVMPMFTGEEVLFERAEEALSERFGSVDYRSQDLPFDHTDYYTAEFGPRLLRRFVAFERLIDPGHLADIKVLSNDLESTWSEAGQRRINLDPGYVSAAKLVLATTKNHGHRIYIGQGIYAEVTLGYHNGDFCAFEWTYPDYAGEPYRQIMREIRAIYMQQLRAVRQSGSLTPR